ncbi:hypothetical protein O1L68_12165 [Streptomyces lydicus]|nr:hypothetical protein [Streptomyces lydicus]
MDASRPEQHCPGRRNGKSDSATAPLRARTTAPPGGPTHEPATRRPPAAPAGRPDRRVRRPARPLPGRRSQDPTPCEGSRDAATIVDRQGREVAGCVHHCARLLAGLEGARVHPFVPTSQALDIYSRARELPPFAWEIGR